MFGSIYSILLMYNLVLLYMREAGGARFMSVEVKNLTKRYRIRKRAANRKEAVRQLIAPQHKWITAVDNLSFTILTGEIVGFIGANGAGKSTTLKMLTGILTPDQGDIMINGLDMKKYHRQIVSKIGVVFGQRSQLCWDIPVMESFRLFKDMYHVPKAVYKENIEIFSDILNLSDFVQKPPRLLSLGQRMKADLAAALLHNPDVLFLDEPTIGIDVLAKMKIRDFIHTINRERNTTIILTTHDMSDIEDLCEKMIIIDKGKLLYSGTLNELKRTYHASDTGTIGEADNTDCSLESIIRSVYEGEFL